MATGTQIFPVKTFSIVAGCQNEMRDHVPWAYGDDG